MTPRQRAQRRRNWLRKRHGSPTRPLRRSNLSIRELAAERYPGRGYAPTCLNYARSVKRFWETGICAGWWWRDKHGRPY